MQQNLFEEYKEVFSEDEEVADIRKDKVKNFGYSPFALQDAIGEKSAKKAWIEYQKLRFDGIEPEEIIFKITVKIRDMLMILRGVDKESLELKDYPYSKSKKDSKNWKEEELKDFFTKLVQSYHSARLGGEELDAAIERAILNI